MKPASAYIGKRVTFRDLFKHHSRVEIPIIQRDYAQGRQTASEVRSLFLDALFSALSKPSGDATLPLDLDFVYGSIEGEGQPAFCPLDGQQRLTTLFLLHWYLAWVDGKTEAFRIFACENERSRLAYAVRASSGEFFDSLAIWSPPMRPAAVKWLRPLIEDQPWFFQWWMRDPTIQSALTVLEAIHVKFQETSGFYERLVQSEPPYITVQLLDLENFGLSDDLYIKMNARGKPLTSFETLKALVEKHIGVVFPEPGARELLGRKVTLKEYFSHQIDTTWAEALWTYRDGMTNVFDGRVMNLIHAVAIITRDPEPDATEDIVETLKTVSTFSFQRYIDNKCLDGAHIDLLITVLDACSGSTAGIHTYLKDTAYFDEESAFRRIVEQGGNSTYAELIQFGAYAWFLREHGLAADADRFGDWMRVIRNLTVNSNIERPAQFRRSLRSVNEMLKHSDRILAFLAEGGGKVEGFNVQQIREERIKSALILKSSRWKDAVLKAEQHGYFNGQIEFVLDFSEILRAWTAKSSCDWNDSEDDVHFAQFSDYIAKARLLFNDTGLIALGENRTERALLAIGDYTLEKGQNRSFLEDSEDPISWKRLLRGEHVQQAGPRRGYVKLLLDKIDTKAGVRKSLDDIITTSIVSDNWRRLMVKNPKLLEYCGKRQIRYYSSSNVYLLKGVRRSGKHVELFSYQLYWEVIVGKVAHGEMAPFRDPFYNFVDTDEYEPWISLQYVDANVRLVMLIWNYNGKFRVRIDPTVGHFPAELKQDLEAQPGCISGSDGNPCFDFEMVGFEKGLDGVMVVFRKHLHG
jgi:hypothetical protein